MTCKLRLAAAVALALSATGCGAVEAVQKGLGTGSATSRAGRMCFVRDATFSGAVNGRAYMAVIRAELPQIIADEGPESVCVVDVTGNPSVSSSVYRFPLVSHASSLAMRRRETNVRLAELQRLLIAPYRRPPKCLAHPGAAGQGAASGARGHRPLAGPSHASGVFETFLLAARSGGLRPGDRIVGLTDGIERRGDVNLTVTPLLALTREQPAGRLAVFGRLVRQGAAPHDALRGIRVELPAPGSPVCGAPYSESRGEQIRLLWERDWARRTGAVVQWK
ncbi:hypothetical protein [Baekduia sp. Peel2402]|uniref:hypothetical protein n=1 Tax=Baekduia sp. Peel2402 TaxID=3458296 RepID=UPI00403E3FAB